MADTDKAVDNWILYGATGYTGQLIAHEAKRRGLRPILAGRNAEKVKKLADTLELPWAAFSDRKSVV